MELMEKCYLIVYVFNPFRMKYAIEGRIIIWKRLCHIYAIACKTLSLAVFREQIGCPHDIPSCSKPTAVHAIACRQVQDES
jgi:hypothetical protein